jgi:hypothetical protein
MMNRLATFFLPSPSSHYPLASSAALHPATILQVCSPETLVSPPLSLFFFTYLAKSGEELAGKKLYARRERQALVDRCGTCRYYKCESFSLSLSLPLPLPFCLVIPIILCVG